MRHSGIYFILLSSIIFFSCDKGIQPVSETSVVMDTYATITVYDNDKSEAEKQDAIRRAFEGMRLIEKITNNYDETSEASAVNKALGKTVEISAELKRCLTEAQRIAYLSEGSLDVTVGPLINLWNFVNLGFHIIM